MLPQHLAPLPQTIESEQQTEPGAPAIPLQHVEFLGTGRAPQYFQLAGSSRGGRYGFPSPLRGLSVGLIIGARTSLPSVHFAFGAPQTPLQQTASGAQQIAPQHVLPTPQMIEPAQHVENGAPAMPLQHVALTGTGRTPQYF